MKAWRLSNSRLAARAKKAVSTEEQEHLKSRMITKQQVKHQFLKIDKNKVLFQKNLNNIYKSKKI